jgi:hypothetical protein
MFKNGEQTDLRAEGDCAPLILDKQIHNATYNAMKYS